MKKKLVLIGIAILVVMSMTACQANEPGAENPENENITEDMNDVTDIGQISDEDSNNGNQNNDQMDYELTEEGIITTESAREIIQVTANDVIYAISDKDAETIADHTHPEKGVRFTPYTNVSEDDVVFSKEEIVNFFEDEEAYAWGSYDGKGNEISLTPSQYYEEFIYTKDFVNAEEVGYNEVLIDGNMIENQFEVYDNPIVAEYYFPGSEDEYAGMDWESLRLVFEEYENDWKLVGVIHNQWTI